MSTSARLLSQAFAAALGDCGEPAPGALLGIEHEYSVVAAGRALDFRELIHKLPIPGKRLDPGDVNAYRLESGLALTCDEAEAEIASPPIAVEPGFTTAVEVWANQGKADLGRLLPASSDIRGYSTHLSVAMPTTLNDAACHLYVRAFAPALALLLERASSQGVYVRPRPGRIELCGEYAHGPRLGAVAAFAAGSAQACAQAAAGETVASSFPPTLAVEVLPGRERYGVRVLRSAFGPDLYRDGRHALLRRASGGTILAQDVLDLAWATARQALGPRAASADLAVAERMVSGDLPLGVESHAEHHPGQVTAGAGQSPFGRLLARRVRPSFQATPTIATWDFTVFRLEGTGRVAFASVPRGSLTAFLTKLERGDLDEIVSGYLRTPPMGVGLTRRAQVARPGLYDGVGATTALLPEEREPVGAWAEGESQPGAGDGEQPGGRPAKSQGRRGKGAGPGAGRRGKQPATRPGKRSGRPGKLVALPPSARPPVEFEPPTLLPPRPEPAPAPAPVEPSPPGTHIPWPLISAVGAAAIVAVAIGAIFLSGEQSHPGTETPTPRIADSPVPVASPATTVPPAKSETPTVKPTESPTAKPSESPTVAGAVTTPATNTPTVRPTETRIPVATPTPTPTKPPQPTEPPTRTPTPTPTKAPPTNTSFPLPTFIPPPCVPSPGTTCPP